MRMGCMARALRAPQQLKQENKVVAILIERHFFPPSPSSLHYKTLAMPLTRSLTLQQSPLSAKFCAVMESKRARLGCLFFLVLLLASQEVAVVAQPQQPRVCETRSGRFTGPCMGTANCAQMCMTEGFTGGSCDMIRRCMCQKAC